MTVAAMHLQAVGQLRASVHGVLEREHQPPPRPQRLCRGGQHRLEIAEIHERVGGHDDVEGVRVVPHVRRELGALQLVVHVLVPRVRQHGVREVHAYQLAGVRRDERTAEPRAAPGVEHVEAPRRHDPGFLEDRRDECGRAVREPRELRLEALGEAVERALDESVRRARRHLATRARRQHVDGDRIARLFGEPVLEDRHGLAHFAQRAVGQREQLAGFLVLRPERDHLAVADRGFVAALEPVEQNAEVRVGVDVLRIQANRGAVRGFGFHGSSHGPQEHAQIAVGIRVTRIERDRAAIRVDGRVQIAGRLQDDAEVAVPVRLAGTEREGSFDERNGVVVPALLVRENA
jgi:hypothetical protein